MTTKRASLFECQLCKKNYSPEDPGNPFWVPLRSLPNFDPCHHCSFECYLGEAYKRFPGVQYNRFKCYIEEYTGEVYDPRHIEFKVLPEPEKSSPELEEVYYEAKRVRLTQDEMEIDNSAQG